MGLIHCYTWASSSSGKQGLLFVAVHRLLGQWLLLLRRVGSGPWVSVAVACRLSSCGSQAQLPHGMWDLTGPGIELVSPALAGRIPTMGLPEVPNTRYFYYHDILHCWGVKNLRQTPWRASWQQRLPNFKVHTPCDILIKLFLKICLLRHVKHACRTLNTDDQQISTKIS